MVKVRHSLSTLPNLSYSAIRPSSCLSVICLPEREREREREGRRETGTCVMYVHILYIIIYIYIYTYIYIYICVCVCNVQSVYVYTDVLAQLANTDTQSELFHAPRCQAELLRPSLFHAGSINHLNLMHPHVKERDAAKKQVDSKE